MSGALKNCHSYFFLLNQGTFYLVESRQGPESCDEGVDEGGGHISPLPPLLSGVGRRGGDEEVADGVDQDEGDNPAPDHKPPAAALPFPYVRHGHLQESLFHIDMSSNCVYLVFVDVFLFLIKLSTFCTRFYQCHKKGIFS